MHFPSIRTLPCLMVLAAASTLAAAQAPVYGPQGQAPAHAPAPPVVKEGTTVKISQHVYLIPDEKAAMVPNVGIIVGSKATLVVDPGMGVRSGEVVLREARKISNNTELYIVSSHFHPEHTTGEAAFPASAKVVRAVAQQQDIDEMGLKWVKNFSDRSPVIAGVLQGIDGFRVPSELFEKEKVLDLGGVRVRVIRLGPGHTRGDTVVFVEGDRVLFSGDLAMKQLFPAFATPQSRSQSWLASLDQLDALKARTVIGAHYPVTDASVIGEYRDYLKALQARVAEVKRQGKTSDETAEQLRAEFHARYPTWDQPLRVHPAVTVIYAELP
jgi:glyoxylase-like metal-dependent hydrolase (beta-lactamase superfamily II)